MPRAGLSADVVIDEAARLVDDVGWGDLTLAALASRLGVAVPSLYKHLDGLPAVRRGVATRSVQELGAALEAALGRAPATPSARLRSLAIAYRTFALDHPGRYAATVRAPVPDDQPHLAASEAVLATVLAVLAERGLHGDDAVDAARTLRAALHGFVTLEAAGGFGLSRDAGRSFDRLVDVLDVGLAAL